MSIKINDTLYPATIIGGRAIKSWGTRETKTIIAEMDVTTATSLFVDDVIWGEEVPMPAVPDPETGEMVERPPVYYDYSDYCMAGSITDNRDGTVTVVMGKLTDSELLAIMMGGN